jgi:hypothetical protein
MSQPFRDFGQGSQIPEITLPALRVRIWFAQSCHPAPFVDGVLPIGRPMILTTVSSASAGQHPPNRASAEIWVSCLVCCPELGCVYSKSTTAIVLQPRDPRVDGLAHRNLWLYICLQGGVGWQLTGWSPFTMKTEPQVMPTYRLPTTKCLHPAVAFDNFNPSAATTFTLRLCVFVVLSTLPLLPCCGSPSSSRALLMPRGS